MQNKLKEINNRIKNIHQIITKQSYCTCNKENSILNRVNHHISICNNALNDLILERDLLLEKRDKYIK